MKTLKIALIGTGLVLTVVAIKYKPAYQVTVSGETLGYIESKEFIEKKIDKYMSDTTGNIAFREIANLPEYELKLINREEETKEEEVMLAVENSTKTTYKMYAVTADGEQKAIVDSTETAQNIIQEITSDLNPSIDLKLGVIEVYTTNNTTNSVDEIKNSLNEIKSIKVAAYEKEQKLAAEKAKAAKRAAQKARSIATTANSPATGNIAGMALSIPVNGSISSRFGSRSSSRSSIHTGLDISTSTGTGIRAIAPGTVTYSGMKGSYGYLIVINHGNGVESYYAHCSALYVGVGQPVDSNTTIAAVGSTGNSTGPHLHLEIRVNGTPVNPQNYLY